MKLEDKDYDRALFGRCFVILQRLKVGLMRRCLLILVKV
jgi:hypothetical protein